MNLSVVEPAKDAAVAVPFTVKVQTSVPLGTTESGEHHVHVWFDDNAEDYLVVESDTTTVSNLPPGDHIIHVSLRNANHSPAGAETEIPVKVGTGSGPTPTATGAPSEDSDGY